MCKLTSTVSRTCSWGHFIAEFFGKNYRGSLFSRIFQYKLPTTTAQNDTDTYIDDNVDRSCVWSQVRINCEYSEHH